MVQEEKIAIAATFTAEPVKESLSFWMRELKIPLKIEFAPYNQVFQQLLDPSGLFSKNRRGFNILLVRLEDWDGPDKAWTARSEGHPNTSLNLKRTVEDFGKTLKAAAMRSQVPLIICICPYSPVTLCDRDRTALFDWAENRLASQLKEVGGLYLVKSSEFAGTYPVSDYYDLYGDRLGHIPFTADFFTSLGSLTARKIHALRTAPYKVLVVDCDQTLWKGVCGEDGPFGLEIDPPRRTLQEILVAQHDAGMLICICSKNNEQDVEEVFQLHPEMPLARDHVVSWRVNWRPKSENIKSLAQELNLALDSFILIDDNPVECAEVRANCPDVLVLQLPQDPAGIPKFLQHVWALDHLKVTDEDKTRTVLYKQNLQRERFSKESSGLEEFLAGLGLDVEIQGMGPHHLSRVSQLTHRTKQFNFTTIKRSEAELHKLCHSGELECLVVGVRDRFGDYGLVGVIAFRAGEQAIILDNFLLSCRALGKGVEHRMLAKVGEIARDRGLQRVDVPLFLSGKNQPAIDFLNAVATQFREPAQSGYLFKCPAEWTAKLTYRPCDYETPGHPVSEGMASASSEAILESETHERTALLLRIAQELHAVEQVRSAMNSQGQRPRPNLDSDFVAPRNATEEAVSEIWCEVLGIDRVGVGDNFFELGGDSVLMTQIVARIRHSLGADLSLLSFFESPTIAGIAQALSDKHAEFIEGLLTEISQISEEEVKSRIKKEGLSLQHDGTGLAVEEGVTQIDPLVMTDRSHPFNRSLAPDSAPAIGSVGIMTKNRLDGLERALIGYIQNSKTYGRNNDFIVIDDPDDKNMQSRCQDMLRHLKNRHGVKILYAGREDKDLYADRLIARSGVPAEVVKFALFDVEECGQSYGISRNALLLHTIGDMVFSADDDTVCRIAPTPDQVPGLMLTSKWDPPEVRFFPDRQTALESVSFVETDPLAIHEQLLGKNVFALVATHGKNGQSAPDSGLLNRLQASQGKVLVSFNGLLGDCAWGAPFGYWGGPMGCLILNERSHQRLTRSYSDYRSACISREILRVVDCLTVSEETLCMTVFMGIDNRDILPPFLPVKRGEDIVFGLTLRRCLENGHFGHLPWALVHSPTEKRAFWPGEIFRSAAGFDTAKMIIACVKSFDHESPRGSGKEKLRALGKQLVKLGAMPLRDFEEVLRQQVCDSATSFMLMAESRLRAAGGSPQFWANDLHKYMELLRKGITGKDYWVPLDLLDRRNVDEARHLAHRLVRKFGELLYWWPDMVEAASEMRANGERLARPIR